MISKDGERKKKRKKEMVFLEANKFDSRLIFLAVHWELFSEAWTLKTTPIHNFIIHSLEFEENSKGENALKSASYTYNRVDTGQTPAS